MNKKNRGNACNQKKSIVNRRDLLKGAAVVGLGVATGTYGASKKSGEPSKSSKSDLIQRENAKPGTRDWLLTNPRTLPGKINNILRNGRCPWIEGYCSANSIRAGETLKVMVSTNPASPFKLEIFRTGYYNGDGARLMRAYDKLEGVAQPEPTAGENYVHECNWEPSVEFEIPKDWLSGVYLGKLTESTSGIQSYVIFIVRDDRPCDLLFQCSELTWSAYNRWPADFSIYTPHEGMTSTSVPSGSVSFDRPYGLFTHPVNKHKTSGGSGEFLPWEFPLSFWLEQHGYDVSYISNIDTHADPAGLLRAKGFISVGHDEYWSLEMYDNVLKARDAGVSLAFLSANAVLCVVPMLPSSDDTANRIIRREGWFFGEPSEADKERAKRRASSRDDFNPVIGPAGNQLMGAQTTPPVMGAGDWTCAMPEHWLFEGTGMKKGDSIKGIVGWEWHGAPAKDLPGLQIVAEGETSMNGKNPGHYTATIYDGPKGNIVFNASTIWWANGLSSPPGHATPVRHGVAQQGVDKRVQQITHNLFERITK
ncbi:twin-arginine translocation signal domain-containing protein [Verrucomicrobia bacterium]|nr:twin-arginine translocation signal domain-containing protein [Verrucomicrobiota bacterium]